MPFDQCAECRRCCFVEEGYPPLEISLTKKENQDLGSVCIETNCPHLGPAGCTLGDRKPFSCKLYPLAYNPARRELFYDTDCPVMPEYIGQLKDKTSEASRHLADSTKELARLEKTDSGFLKTNFEIDADYFDLKKLPFQPFSKDN